MGIRVATFRNEDPGWVHPQSQKGDVLAKIYRCQRLVILRPVLEAYEVIGEASLLSYHGPDAEAMEEITIC